MKEKKAKIEKSKDAREATPAELESVQGGATLFGRYVPNPIKAIRNRLPKWAGGRSKGSISNTMEGYHDPTSPNYGRTR